MVWLDRFTYRIMASPVLWGGAAAVAFHWLLRKSGEAVPPAMLRCLTGSWDTYLSTTLFFIALAFGIVRALELAIDWWALQTSLPSADGDQNTRTKPPGATELLESMEKTAWMRRSSWYQRLREAHRLSKSPLAATDVSTQLQSLSDEQFDRLRQRYSFVRLITWAIPSVGSVATVWSIAKAVELLSPGPSDSLFASVAGGLSSAFQTFALTIGLSAILVIMRNVLEQFDNRQFAVVDRHLERLLGASPDSRASQSDAVQEQLRQLTEGLRAISTTLAQQVNFARTGPSATNSPAAAAPVSSGMDPKDVELLVQRAVAAVAQRMPTAGPANDGGGMDSAGWKSLQQVLQKLSHVLELQNAKLESEGRVSKQLSAIIDEGLNETRPALKVRNSA